MKRRSWMTNRDVKRQPKAGGYWCPSCDGAVVREGGRCPVCRKVAGVVRRDKK